MLSPARISKARKRFDRGNIAGFGPADRGISRSDGREPEAFGVFVHGQPARSMYILVSGKVKISSEAGDGRQRLSVVVGPSEVFGEVAVLDSGPRTSSATALTGVSAATTDRELLSAWLTSRPELTHRLLRMMARRLRRTGDRLFLEDVAGHVAKELLVLAHRYGVREGEGVRLDHDLTQEELAQLIGATRETVDEAQN